MMSATLEVPQIADLGDLPIEVAPLDAPGVVAVTAWATDGAAVTLTWDVIARSVSVRWLEAGDERLTLEREAASKVSVREERGQVEFWVWSDTQDLAGQLVVRVGDHVGVSDAILHR
jgi:hypothetical protein